MLKGKLLWKIHELDTWVAGIQLSRRGPLVLLADHLKGEFPIHIYKVKDITEAAEELKRKGWKEEAGLFEIPNGPCYTFRDPAGIRLAIYENRRRKINRKFQGRIDST